MGRWLSDLDQILRGDVTRLSSLRRGSVELSLSGLVAVIVLLGMIYGLCMGSYALFKGGGPSFIQVFASMVKVPLLFLLTLIVTFPSLYVFNALVGSRLSAVSVLQLLIAALGVMLAVLASFGPIVAFFSVSSTSYPFMQLLNVAVFAIAGFLGLKFLLLTLHRLSVIKSEIMETTDATVEKPPSAATIEKQPSAPDQPKSKEPEGALDWVEGQILGRNVRTVFQVWVVVFALVGAQMGWVLRPFIGNPDTPFTWFRVRESSFFEAVLGALNSVFS